MKKLFFFCFLSLLLYSAAAQRRDTFSVYFPFNQSALSPEAQAQIDSLSYNDVLHESQQVQITGYADYVGGEGYNSTLSRERARAVAAYLESIGIRNENITLCIGKGEVARPGSSSSQGNAPDRRVDVLLTTVKRPAADVLPTAVRQPTIAAAPHPRHAPDLAHARRGETALLDKIFFYAGRHTVRQESQPALDELLRMLQRRTTMHIRIEGHVCCINGPDAMDDDTGELKLSANRARAIYDFLVAGGIAAARLDWAGYGHFKPLVPVEVTEDDANQNRRVEIRVISE